MYAVRGNCHAFRNGLVIGLQPVRRSKNKKADLHHKGPPPCDRFYRYQFNKAGPGGQLWLKSQVKKIKRRLTQTCDVIGQRTDLAIIQLGGYLAHLQAVQAYAVTEISQLGGHIFSVLPG